MRLYVQLLNLCPYIRAFKYGADVAERKRHIDLGREAYVQIPLRIDDLQRWWDGEGPKNEFLGLYVEALYRGENLAVHPQQDPINVSIIDYFCP